VCQPESVTGRRSAEHWAGTLWGRRVSVYFTRLAVRTPITANQVTVAMIVIGLAGSAALLLGGLIGPALCAVAIQLYILADCIDGEIARWTQTTSPRGVYLDRLGHYIVESSLFPAFGYAVGGSWTSGWVSVGLATSVLALITKAETDLVPWHLHDSTALGEATYDDMVTPRSATIRLARAATHPLKIHRWTGAAEASLLMFLAAIVSQWWDQANEALAIGLLAIALALLFGHGLSIWNSPRLNFENTASK
jgi:phosphatidylglycerophosphate synthase